MEIKELVRTWFRKWEEGDFENIPVAEDFKHISPYGTIDGKGPYLDLVRSNKDKFLGNRFEFHDEIYHQDKACIRYTVSSKDFSMEVSEWIYSENSQIREIISYYNIEGEISDDRKLAPPE